MPFSSPECSFVGVLTVEGASKLDVELEGTILPDEVLSSSCMRLEATEEESMRSSACPSGRLPVLLPSSFASSASAPAPAPPSYVSPSRAELEAWFWPRIEFQIHVVLSLYIDLGLEGLTVAEDVEGVTVPRLASLDMLDALAVPGIAAVFAGEVVGDASLLTDGPSFSSSKVVKEGPTEAFALPIGSNGRGPSDDRLKVLTLRMEAARDDGPRETSPAAITAEMGSTGEGGPGCLAWFGDRGWLDRPSGRPLERGHVA